MRLEIEGSGDLPGDIEQDVVHGNISFPKEGRAFQEKHVRKAFGGFFQDYGAIRINNDFIYLSGSLQGMNDMVVEGFTGKGPVIFSGHALAEMAHGNDSDDRMAHEEKKLA
jgi:hypothetical protein